MLDSVSEWILVLSCTFEFVTEEHSKIKFEKYFSPNSQAVWVAESLLNFLHKYLNCAYFLLPRMTVFFSSSVGYVFIAFQVQQMHAF